MEGLPAYVDFHSGDIVAKKYVLKDRIGTGAFGDLFHATVLCHGNSQSVAIKFERKTKSRTYLLGDYYSLRKLAGNRHFPQIYDFGCENDIYYLVVELLGPSLLSLVNKQRNYHFSLPTILMIGIQGVEALASVHEKGLIHRDVKPANFLVSRFPHEQHELYLIDFGLVKQMLTKEEMSKPVHQNVHFRGTYRYCSVNGHLNKELGRRDDLISLIYVMIELRSGGLAWSQTKNESEVHRLKQTSAESGILFQGFPPELKEAYHYLMSLNYFDDIDYDKIVCLFRSALSCCTNDLDPPFDWEQTNSTSVSVLHQTTDALSFNSPLASKRQHFTEPPLTLANSEMSFSQLPYTQQDDAINPESTISQMRYMTSPYSSQDSRVFPSQVVDQVRLSNHKIGLNYAKSHTQGTLDSIGSVSVDNVTSQMCPDLSEQQQVFVVHVTTDTSPKDSSGPAHCPPCQPCPPCQHSQLVSQTKNQHRADQSREYTMDLLASRNQQLINQVNDLQDRLNKYKNTLNTRTSTLTQSLHESLDQINKLTHDCEEVKIQRDNLKAIINGKDDQIAHLQGMIVELRKVQRHQKQPSSLSSNTERSQQILESLAIDSESVPFQTERLQRISDSPVQRGRSCSPSSRRQRPMPKGTRGQLPLQPKNEGLYQFQELEQRRMEFGRLEREIKKRDDKIEQLREENEKVRQEKRDLLMEMNRNHQKRNLKEEQLLRRVSGLDETNKKVQATLAQKNGYIRVLEDAVLSLQQKLDREKQKNAGAKGNKGKVHQKQSRSRSKENKRLQEASSLEMNGGDAFDSVMGRLEMEKKTWNGDLNGTTNQWVKQNTPQLNVHEQNMHTSQHLSDIQADESSRWNLGEINAQPPAFTSSSTTVHPQNQFITTYAATQFTSHIDSHDIDDSLNQGNSTDELLNGKETTSVDIEIARILNEDLSDRPPTPDDFVLMKGSQNHFVDTLQSSSQQSTHHTQIGVLEQAVRKDILTDVSSELSSILVEEVPETSQLTTTTPNKSDQQERSRRTHFTDDNPQLQSDNLRQTLPKNKETCDKDEDSDLIQSILRKRNRNETDKTISDKPPPKYLSVLRTSKLDKDSQQQQNDKHESLERRKQYDRHTQLEMKAKQERSKTSGEKKSRPGTGSPTKKSNPRKEQHAPSISSDRSKIQGTVVSDQTNHSERLKKSEGKDGSTKRTMDDFLKELTGG
ncbi:putative Tau-tubulin kinase [Blattamonas nauphoetae]|uniref:non-specific serine/threonine protein kinase n=1 Tax=Blattamonas nauphoetae TaxID=2049346 RepID=A0ABQ9XI78_9EUKA|nr:putative Tau-tubulin kinase [Blattamonas nauphoetae]